MLIDSSIVGLKGKEKIFEVEKGAIRAFAHAIGDDNPLYTDESYARAHGFPSIVAPPTFPTTNFVPVPFQFDAKWSLHGAQEYIYERPIVAGDVLRCNGEIVDVYQRQGKSGKMTFVVMEERGEELEGNLVFRVKKTLIMRHKELFL
jgi:acyl dehydratase